MAIKDLFKRGEAEEEASQPDAVHAPRAAPSGVTANLGELQPRKQATVAAEVTGLRTVSAADGSAWLEATLEDGTGTLVVLWTGRTSIPGIRPGARLIVTGRPLPASRSGQPTIYNPSYELLA